jgi:hypothetical protein
MGEVIMLGIVNMYLMGWKRREFLAPKIRCKDGFEFSVQASTTHYCEPRSNVGPWNAVEVGFPNAEEELLLPYAEDPEHPTETVYAYVPVGVVEEVIKKHGGFAQCMRLPVEVVLGGEEMNRLLKGEVIYAGIDREDIVVMTEDDHAVHVSEVYCESCDERVRLWR